MEQYNNIQQAYKKNPGEEKKPVSFTTPIQAVYDGKTGASLEAILAQFNSVYVQYQGTPQSTRNIIPEVMRRAGLKISYKDMEGTTIEEQCRDDKDKFTDAFGNDENWIRYDNLLENIEKTYYIALERVVAVIDKLKEGVTPDMLSESVKQLLAEAGANITNLPDEEDITTTGGTVPTLKFKDKEYLPEMASGLGRIILRKNFAGGKNILTQEMVSKPNTIYIIQYDYDLGGETLTIPEGCTLDFQGGSFSNGTIVGNKTSFIDNPRFNNIDFSGLFNINTIDSLWFNDINGENKLKSLFKLTNKDYDNVVLIRSGNYILDAKSANDNIIDLNSNTTVIIDGTISLLANGFSGYRIFSIQNQKNITVKGNGIIIGDKANHDFTEDGSHEYGHGIYCYQSENVNIEGLEIKECTGDAINVTNSSSSLIINNIKIKNCKLHDSRRQGISVVSANNVIIENNKIYNIRGTLPMAAIDVEPNEGGKSNNIIIRNNNIENCHNGIYLIGISSKNTKVSNVIIENIVIKNCDGISFRNRAYNISVSNTIINVPETINPEVYSSPILIDEGDIAFNKCIIENKSSNVLIHSGYKTTLSNCDITSNGPVYSIYGDIIFDRCNIDCETSLVSTLANNNAKSYFYNNIIKGHFYKIDKTFVFLNNTITHNDASKPCIYSESSLSYVYIGYNQFKGNANVYVPWFLRLNSTPSVLGLVSDNTFSFNEEKAEGCIMTYNTNWICINNKSYGIPLDQNFIDRGNNTMLSLIQKHGAERPSLNVSEKGHTFFDTTLNKPIWWTGTKWVDATGAEV